MSTTDGYIGMFRVPEAGALIPYVNDVSAMTMQVLESGIQVGNGTLSNAIIDISNVDILTSGAQITEVILQHYSTDWLVANTYNVNWTNVDNTGKFVYGPVSWSISGIEHDFRAYFQNGDGQLAIQESDGQVIGIDLYLEDLDVTFNGFNDLAEYPEVLNLVATNTTNSEGGTYAAPSVIPGNGIIRLSWKDMKTQAVDLTNHPMADGPSSHTVTVEQWKNIVGYKVFMYIAVPVTGAEPSNYYPDPGEPSANGKWYLVAETQDNYAEVDCPKAEKIAFWVGGVIRLSAPSNTIDIAPLPYEIYAGGGS
jgi:hypothetical protein